MCEKRNKSLHALAASLVLFAVAVSARADAEAPKQQPVAAAMYSAGRINDALLRKAKAARFRSIVLELKGGSKEQRQGERAAAGRIRNSGLGLSYWIEIARCPELADKHPRWMASIQGHQQWRRLFKDFPRPGRNEVVKVYPWVPILYREAFDAHVKRVKALLRDLPSPKRIYLNDLQGAPSACGCSSPLCRWTTDYGPIKTASKLGDNAAAKFLAAVRKLSPDSQVVPVWVTECEEHDGAKDGWCAGVGCFRGICWKVFTQQLVPVARTTKTLAVLTTFRKFEHGSLNPKSRPGWITTALESFQTMPRRYKKQGVPTARLIAVVQGWEMSPADVTAQWKLTRTAGAAGVVVAFDKIEQSWRPKIIRWRK